MWLSIAAASHAQKVPLHKGVSIWLLLGVVAIAGAVGGAANALVSEKGVALPQKTSSDVWQPGWLGAVLVGIVAGTLSWALYGPAANATVMSTKPFTAETFVLSFASLAGVALVGFSGAKWLSTEADKRIAQANTKEAMTKNANPEQAARLADAKPRVAAEMLSQMP